MSKTADGTQHKYNVKSEGGARQTISVAYVEEGKGSLGLLVPAAEAEKTLDAVYRDIKAKRVLAMAVINNTLSPLKLKGILWFGGKYVSQTATIRDTGNAATLRPRDAFQRDSFLPWAKPAFQPRFLFPDPQTTACTNIS